MANSHGELKKRQESANSLKLSLTDGDPWRMVENSEDGPRICYQQGRISGSRIFASKNRPSVTWLLVLPLACTSYGNFKMIKISTTQFGTITMRRRMRACTYQFLATVTEGIVHDVFQGVTWQHKANGGKWTLCNCVTRSHVNSS